MKYLLVGLLKVYRAVISPLYGQVCKYYPSCSAYALEAVTVHGAIKGSWLAARRLGRCNPWSDGGYDPVPDTPAAAEWEAELAAKASAPTKISAGTDRCCERGNE
ncbi:MAG: membrane protein insertion efficiency factor YidD [Propionibacteriaceae bacterium]|nr:membrane protein insertion efficiency factor YidD [Micropruina sp.]HBX81179.1 membrane protein insertion efficiency factor YidD [Propionibacteriaceae bacterium]HBY24297.1 membrane protein insertion efficiency factor YidD [Propionibacteriaceae bacterium]